MQIRSAFVRGLAAGFGFSLALSVSALVAITVSGTVNSFAAGEVISAAELNENFTSLKNAVEGIPAIEGSTSGPARYLQIGDTLIQWGGASCSTGGGTVTTLPRAFGSTDFYVAHSSSNQHSDTFTVVSASATTINCTSPTGTPWIHFIAIGPKS